MGITPYSNDMIRGDGVFEKVMSAANELIKRTVNTKKTIPLALQISLTAINKDEIKDMHEFFSKSPFLSVNIGDITLVGNARDNQTIKVPENEYDSLIFDLLKDYSMSKNPKYNLHLKGLNIYETIYYNSILDISLDLVLPSCAAYHGYYSILLDSTLCKCVALKGIKDATKYDLYSHNILETATFDPSLKENDTIKPIKLGFCNECRYTEKCNLCLLIDEDGELAFDQKCKVAYQKLKRF
ncbi:hypothetical protein [Thermoanaerobacterium sp. RBIITD]|uniref:hypothetical protein n=1 Tax=Thermoanaerobacterium sp. RBIITD TaxID=1550240 RepID=UPI000BB7D0AE|nr:hypothetical protein [Thermoanaerobacterium sp. RBIITD]SNX55022.1 hypothetical protein SAMN05660242_2805 [Thermoanaerobacterium sp. RBIITD]